MASPSPLKRQCRSHSFRTTLPSHLDDLLESVLVMSDPSIPLDLSLERILESRDLESDKENLIRNALRVGSALVDAANRSARKLASAHNSIVWPLPPELTVKIFSLLDTTSVCYASATCTAFSKCACDSLCYANIDLTQNLSKLNNSVVFTMIQRAGKDLESIKLGDNSINQGMCDWQRNRSLTRSCLVALSSDNGVSGALLKKLSLNNLGTIDTKTLIFALSTCRNLVDLELINLLKLELLQILTAVSIYCPLIERLNYDASHRGGCYSGSLGNRSFHELANNCKKLSSLSIRGCTLYDHDLEILLKGLKKLKYVDLSFSIRLTGSFLRNFGDGDGGDCLETLILCNSSDLTEDAISDFLNDILNGKWKMLRHLDISLRRRFAIQRGEQIASWFRTSRPEICFRAEISTYDLCCDGDGMCSPTSSTDASSPTYSSYTSSETSSSSDDESVPSGDERILYSMSE